MKNFKYLTLLLLLAILIMPACGDDEPDAPDALSVTAVSATGTSFEDGSSRTSDLNGSASSEDVALNATITATFDRPVDVTTANASNITLTSDAGSESVTVAGSGSAITIDPDADLKRGTLYTLSISGVTAVDGGALATLTRSFTTEGRAEVVAPNSDAMVAYWSFDGDATDATGTFNADNEVDITYGEDRFGQGNSTAGFDGDRSIIEVPDAAGLMTSDFTLAFWMKTNSAGHVNQNGDPSSNFVMGLGAFLGFQFEIPADFASCKLANSYVLDDGTFVSEDMFFNGSGEDGMNGGWQGWDFVADLTGSGGVEALIKDKWVHIVCTYESTEKLGRMYINGELMKSHDFDLWPEGAPKQNVAGVAYQGADDVEPILAFGFIKSIDSPKWADTPWGDYFKTTSNHFKGDLDDVRVFSAAYTPGDAKALYDAEK